MEIHTIRRTVGAIRMQVEIKSGVPVKYGWYFKCITLLATRFYHDDHYKVFPVEEPVHFSPTKVSAAFQFQISKIIFCVIWSTILSGSASPVKIMNTYISKTAFKFCMGYCWYRQYRRECQSKRCFHSIIPYADRY